MKLVKELTGFCDNALSYQLGEPDKQGLFRKCQKSQKVKCGQFAESVGGTTKVGGYILYIILLYIILYYYTNNCAENTRDLTFDFFNFFPTDVKNSSAMQL